MVRGRLLAWLKRIRYPLVSQKWALYQICLTSWLLCRIIAQQGDIYMDKTFNTEQKAKLTQIINEGMQVLHEIETLNGGLTDTVKAVAEELEIKPAILKKAIKLAHKAEFGKTKQDQELLETILETVGKTL